METQENCDSGFCGLGKWAGTAEVYNGNGDFLGNGSDQRFARTEQDDGRVRIDLAFIGPLKFSGHYFIKSQGNHRTYQGPVNTGFAEAVGELAVDANGYWPITGLSQKLFLAMLPDRSTQLHLSMMFRGEQLIYTIVSENSQVFEDEQSNVPGLVCGTSYDLQGDPKAGREQLLLHRSGTWKGELSTFDGELNLLREDRYEEHVTQSDKNIDVTIVGSYTGQEERYRLITNGWQAWSEMGNVVGSYNLSGGRALTGTFHYLASGLRVWRREIATNDGTTKAVLYNWYHGGKRVGSQQGVLYFEPTN